MRRLSNFIDIRPKDELLIYVEELSFKPYRMEINSRRVGN